MHKILLAPLAALILSACATTATPEPEAQVLDLAGTYAFTTTVQGTGVNGQMRITGVPGAYEGAAYTDVTGEIPISDVDVEGNRATIVAESPDGPVQLVLVFEGDTFTGSWSMGAEGGAIRGRRVNR